MKKQLGFALLSACLVFVLTSLFAACGYTNTQSGAQASSGQTTKVSASPLKVTSIDISLSVPTIRNVVCGTHITEYYQAVFHLPANNGGGQVAFQTTTNNGRSSQPASINIKPRQTSATYTFSQSGQVNSDNVFPGQGGVQVTAPNSYTSALVAPLGPCQPPATANPTPIHSASFELTGVTLNTTPEVTAHRCGTQFTENYTATFQIAPGGPGGTIVFQYTTNSGRSSSANISLPVTAGQTTATYTFTWSGTLTQDHTVPGAGIVMTTSPNQLTSAAAIPEGACNNM